MKVQRWMLTLVLAGAGLLVCRDAATIATGSGIPSSRGTLAAANYESAR